LPLTVVSQLQFYRWQYELFSIRLAVFAYQMYEIARNSSKIRTYGSSRSFKVIDPGVSRKPMCDFLLVINSNFWRIFVFSRYWRLKPENGLLFQPRTCLTPHSAWTSCDINVTYASPKSAFNGLQFRCWQYGSIFIRLAVIAFETREMSRNSKTIWEAESQSLPSRKNTSFRIWYQNVQKNVLCLVPESIMLCLARIILHRAKCTIDYGQCMSF